MKLSRLHLAFAFTLLTSFAQGQWTLTGVPNATASFRSAYFKNATEGFVAGAERIHHTTNGGATWDTVSHGIYWGYLGSGCIVENILFLSPTEGIAAGWSFWDNCEIIFKTYDGGLSWTDIRWGTPAAAFGTYLHDMFFINASQGVCV